MLPVLPKLPAECGVCHVPNATQIVPDRSMGSWNFDVMCSLCLDSFLRIFPIDIRCILSRQLTGKFPKF